MANSPRLWLQEYKKAGIPSSFLQKPSGSMTLLSKKDIDSKTAADLGCGKGRNSFYLVKNGAKLVYSIDFVEEAIREINSLKNSEIKATRHDLTKPWPLPTNSLGLIIDIFCFKHQSTISKQKFYISEINRTLKIGGLLLLDLAAVDDGFYGIEPKSIIKKGVFKITDPITKVDSLLYNKKSLLAEFPNFKLLKFRREKKLGLMHGKNYKRSTLKFLLQKQ